MIPLIASIAACSSGSKNVSAKYTSTSKYSGWSCENLSEELARIQIQAGELTGKLDKDRKNDLIAGTVSAVLFWPALFFIGGNDSGKQDKLAKLLGDAEAIERARGKACAS